MDKASQESSSVSSGLVIVCLRCWDFVSLHAAVKNIHLLWFPRDVSPKAFRAPLSAALPFSSQQQYISLAQAFSLVKPSKWPTQRHHQGRGEYREAANPQTSAFPSQELQKGPRPLCTTAAALSAHCLGFSSQKAKITDSIPKSISPSAKLKKTSSSSSSPVRFPGLGTISVRPNYNTFSLGAKVLLDSSKMSIYMHHTLSATKPVSGQSWEPGEPTWAVSRAHTLLREAELLQQSRALKQDMFWSEHSPGSQTAGLQLPWCCILGMAGQYCRRRLQTQQQSSLKSRESSASPRDQLLLEQQFVHSD